MNTPRILTAFAAVAFAAAALAPSAAGGPWYEWSVKPDSPRAAYAAPCDRRAGEQCTVTKVLPGRTAPTGTRYMKFPKGTIGARVGGHTQYTDGRWHKEPLAPSTVWTVHNK